MVGTTTRHYKVIERIGPVIRWAVAFAVGISVASIALPVQASPLPQTPAPLTISPEATAPLGKPQVLFKGSYVSDPHISAIPYYDISQDGQRFLMIKDDTKPAQIHVIPNWFEQLKRLVPTH